MTPELSGVGFPLWGALAGSLITECHLSCNSVHWRPWYRSLVALP